MHTVMLVDDENLVITSLKASVDWQASGFAIVGEANDGVTALEMVGRLRPDLVFADIRMPGMSGLELIKRAHDSNWGTLFVIISGYAEFAYVQKALNYGVLGYCLKPIDDGEIGQMLARARDALGKARSAKETELLWLLDDAAGRARPLLLELGMDCRDGIFAAVACGAELPVPGHIRHVRLKPGGSRTAYLLREADRGLFTAHFSQALPAGVLGVGMSAARQDEGQLAQAIEEAGIAAYQYFITGGHGIREFGPQGQEQLNAAFAQLEGSIAKRDIGQIQRVLEQLEALMAQGACDIRSAFQAYNIVMYSFTAASAERYDSFLSDYKQLAGAFSGIHELFQYLKGLLQEYSGAKAGPAAPAAKRDTFQNIIAYVNSHFCEDISVHTISRQFAVNPNYVSQLFKRQTGETFTEYTTKLKVNFACNLLKTTELPVAAVADRVGFGDYYYFTRVFKKQVGETPTAYREKHSPA